jgi:hypothetical protein
MKALNLIAWISAGIGAVIILLGVISMFFNNFLNISHLVNVFIVSDSFFLITIALFVYHIGYQNKKD